MSLTLSIKQSHISPRLSTRELETLYLIAHEFKNKEIANILYLSTCTIDSHRKNLLNKLGVNNSAGLISRAYQHGFLPMDTPENIQANINDTNIIRLSAGSMVS